MPPTIAACNTSSKITQDKKNADSEGVIIIIAIIVPLRIISLMVSFLEISFNNLD